MQPKALVGFTGYAGAGKDLAAEALGKDWTRIGFADPIREMLLALDPLVPVPGDSSYRRLSEIVTTLGWHKAKRTIREVRELLQRLGVEGGRDLLGADLWVDLARAKMHPTGSYVITDVRFPNEAEMIHSLGGIVIQISRTNNGPANKHSSEKSLPPSLLDDRIENFGTKLEFQASVLKSVVATFGKVC